MPGRSSRQYRSPIFAIGAVVGLGLASIVTFPAEATGGRISKCATITKPGSYLLTRNLTTAGSCIVVAADFVTIDLGGWVITGDGTTGSGITDEGNQRSSITLRNGTITGFETAVGLGSTAGAVVEKVTALANVTGIATGRNSIVSGNIVRGLPFGITVGPGSIVSDNVAGSADSTITAGFGSIVSGNVVRDGDFGIAAGPGSTVTGNNVGAIEAGISAGPGSTVIGNTAHPQEGSEEILGSGIVVTCPSNVIGNTATGATDGNLVLIGDGCTNIGNLAP